MNNLRSLAFTAALSAINLAAYSAVYAQAPETLPPLVTAGGTGRISVAPAGARLTIATETHAATASVAGVANAAKMARLLDALRHAGFGPQAISTSSFSLNTDRDYGKDGPIDRGYVSTNTIVVTVRDLARVSIVIDSAIAGGATRVSDVNFFVSNPDSTAHVALTLAVAAARSSAETMAAAAGGRLGALYDISNTLGRGPNPFGGDEVYAQIAVAPGTSIHVEDVPVSAGVTARWRFIPK